MTTQERSDLLSSAIQSLMRLYQDLSTQATTAPILKFVMPQGGDLSEEKEKMRKPFSKLIEEAKKMIINLNVKGSLRTRPNGLLEFRSPTFGSVYGRTVDELEFNIKRKIRTFKAKEKISSAPKFFDYVENNFLPYKEKSNLSEKTLAGLRYNVGTLKRTFPNKALKKYTSSEIDHYLLDIPEPRKRQLLRGVLNNVFSRAVMDEIIKSNPCDRVEKFTHKSKTGTAFSFFELREMIQKMINEKMPLEKTAFVLFLFLSGTRRSEATAISVSDIDFKNDILHIPGTKTEKSDRYIPLFPTLRNLLVRLPTSPNGKFFDFSDFKALTLLRQFSTVHTLHHLRHTFGTILICAEALDVKTVSMYLGHSDIAITLKTYTHPEQLDRSLFFRGDISSDEKRQILKAENAEVLDMIDLYLSAYPIYTHKKS